MTNEKQKFLLEWHNLFTDYVQNNYINIYNDAAKYADERQDLESKFLDFPELDEFISCRECTEEAEQDSYFCSDSCAEDYKNNLKFDREKEEN
jgi:hypothetical protein